MGIKPTHRCVDSLFGQKYFIDFYQRDYKWSHAQVETLLSDILFKFDAEYRPQLDPTKANLTQYGWYYLNTYVTNEFEGNLYVVDGQQRLTTLTLILIYLFHRTTRHQVGALAQWLTTKICGFHPEGKTFWMGTGAREIALCDLFEGTDPSAARESDDLSVRNIFANYDVVARILDERLQTTHQLHAFVLYFMYHVELIQLHIDDSRDVAMVFEVINDRGQPLRPYEVFKGELLGQLSKTEIDECYYGLWTDSINPLQNRDEKEPDRFFRLLFRSKFADSRNEYRAFEDEYQRVVFSNAWSDRLRLKRNPNQVKDFIRQKVVGYSRVYQRLLHLAEREGTPVFFNVTLNDLDRLYLLVLSAVADADPAVDQKIELVSRLFDRNFTLLQLTGSYNNNEFTESIIALNSRLRERSLDEIQAAFDDQLLKDIRTVRGISVDDPFQWALFKTASYELGSRFIRYFFARLEHYLAKECHLPVDGYYNLVRNNGAVQGYHVEHILADNSESRELFSHDEEAFVRERNRLGALLLLKGRDNQSSNNEPYNDKLRTYSHSTRLGATLTEAFYHCNLDFADFVRRTGLPFRPLPVFDRDSIEERHQLYFELAKRVWGDDSFPCRSTVSTGLARGIPGTVDPSAAGEV